MIPTTSGFNNNKLSCMQHHIYCNAAKARCTSSKCGDCIPPPKMGCKKQQTNFTREAAQRSTIELYFVIHQNNKLSISASYCNKLIRNKTENKSPTQVHLFTPWFLIHVQSPTSYDWGQMPRKTWGSQVLHGAVLALTHSLCSQMGELDSTRLI